MLFATTREKPSVDGEPGGVDRVAGAGDRARPERQLVDLRQHARRSARGRGAARPRARGRSARRARLRAAQVRVRRHQRVAGVGRADPQAPQSAPEGLAAARARGASDRAADRRRPARCAIGRCAAGGRHRRPAPTARARRTRGRLRPAVRRRCRRTPDRTRRCARISQQRGRESRDAVGCRNHAGALERLRPREAAPHVVFEQAAIEAERRAEREQRRVGIALEPSGPQMRHRQRPTGVVCAAALRAAVSIGSPQILMKPSVALLIELIARVVGRERLIVERERRTCGRRRGSRL